MKDNFKQIQVKLNQLDDAGRDKDDLVYGILIDIVSELKRQREDIAYLNGATMKYEE